MGEDLLEDMLDFSLLRGQLVELLFQDPAKGQMLLTGGADSSDMEVFKEFYLDQQCRVSKRLSRVTAPTLILWGQGDRLIVPAYAERWAAPMLPYEQPQAFVSAVSRFLG